MMAVNHVDKVGQGAPDLHKLSLCSRHHFIDGSVEYDLRLASLIRNRALSKAGKIFVGQGMFLPPCWLEGDTSWSAGGPAAAAGRRGKGGGGGGGAR